MNADVFNLAIPPQLYSYPVATLRSRYAELSQMRTQRIDHLGTLPHQQIARSMLLPLDIR
jgi:hypothetical protein